MGSARELEKRLEGLVEGLFARLFRSGLQPVEVGRRILRGMEEGRTVSVNRVYVPNEFRVYMGLEDHARFAKMEAELQREFSELVLEHAKRNRWNLMGMPRILFELEEGLGEGEFRVEGALQAEAQAEAPWASTREPDQADLGATRAVSIAAAERLGLARPEAEFVVLDRSGRPRERIAITRQPVTIGRLSTNDVVLADPNVSRRHAELRRAGDVWMLVDRGSTNGTLVNGKLAKEHVLKDGDRCTFGTTELEFRTKGVGTRQ